MINALSGSVRKYNHYIETAPASEISPRKCDMCFRWQLCYPYTCKDFILGSDKANTCANYDESPYCPVE